MKKKYGIFETEEPKITKEVPEIEYLTFEEIQPELPLFKEIEEKKPTIFEKSKKFKIKFGKKRDKIVPKEIKKHISLIPSTPTTFRLRINKDGILENIDVKKPKPRPKIKIKFRRKEKKESEGSEEKSKFSKLKRGLSKIKRIIPKRGKEENESEETEKIEDKE